MEKVFAYLRVSDSSQIKGDGFTRQEKAILDYCHSHNLEVKTVYREDITGTEIDRPILASVMVSLEKNHHGVKTVVIEKLDRLARDLMVQEAIIRDFQKHGFNLISTMEGDGLLQDDPTRKLIRQIFGGIAEYEKSMLVAKLRASRDRKRALTGRCEGRTSYEYTEEGQALIRHIQALRRKPKFGRRKTLQQVASQLNEEGYRTIDGKEWSYMRVFQTLQRKH